VVNESKKINGQSAVHREVISIGRTSTWYMIASGLHRSIGFFMIPIYTRFISPTNYGAMDLITILAGSIAVFISLGVSESMARLYYAEPEENQRNRVISTVIIGFGLIGLPIVIVFLLLANYIAMIVSSSEEYVFYMRIAIASVWFAMFIEISYTYLRMLYKAKLFFVITTAQVVIALLLNIYFVVILKLDILGIFYSTFITQSVSSILLVAYMLKNVGFCFSRKYLRRLINFGLPLVPSQIGIILTNASNRFFLRWFGNPDPLIALANVGILSLAQKFGVVLHSFITTPFISFWAPRRTQLLLSKESDAKHTIARICTYAALITNYAALVLSAGIESIIKIMADQEYWSASEIVPLFALAYVIFALEPHFMAGLIYKEKTGPVTFIGIVALLIILIWNYFLIPEFGIYAAATSNLIANIFRSISIYVISQNVYKVPFEMVRLLKILVVALAMFYTSKLIKLESNYLNLTMRTGFVMLYPFCLYFVGFYEKGELNVTKNFAKQIIVNAQKIFIKT